MGGGNVAAGTRQPLSNQTCLYNNVPSVASPLQSSAPGGIPADYSASNANAADQLKPRAALGAGVFCDGMGDERRVSC